MKKRGTGFSLVEMAIVLAIIALLMAGLLPTLSSQIEQQRRNEARMQLAEIQQALMGFAIMKRRLPCAIIPGTAQADPSDAVYGEEPPSCSGDSEQGYLPWKTLGVSEIDPWGTKRNSATAPWNGYWRYRVDRNFSSTFTLTTGFGTCGASPTSDCISIKDSTGATLTTTTERPIAVVFSTGPDLIPNGQNAIFSATGDVYQSDVPGTNPDGTNFDDMLIWISRPQLFNRMVAAGTLP